MSRWLWVCVLSGCGPVIAELSGGDEEGLDGATPEDDTTDPTEVPDSEPIQLVSGTWSLDGFETLEDPCGWNTLLFDWTRLTMESFLPAQFTVTGEADAFEIKAIDYGAQETVRCNFEGDNFTCSQQAVDSIPVSTFFPQNWLYEIDFSGRYVEDGRIEGEAVVVFARVQDSSANALRYAGIDPLDCTQVYSLNITASVP